MGVGGSDGALRVVSAQLLMRKPLVMHIIGGLNPYGSERSMLNLCLGLRNLYAPMVLAFAGGEMETTLAEHGIPYIAMTESEGERAGIWRCFEFCWRNIRRYRPDIVHTHYTYGNVLGRIAAHLQGIPSVGHIREPERRSETALYRVAYRIAQVGRTKLVAVSDSLAEQVEHATGIHPLTIYNAVDNVQFLAPHRPRGSLHHEIGVSPGAFLVGTVGRLDPRKNYPAILRCAKIACDARDDIHFVCVGDGPQLDEMQHLRDDLGLTHRVHFLGYRADVGSILQDIDVFVIASYFEGLPRAVLEAMWARLPIVGTDVIGTRDTIDDGMQGYLVPTEDEAAMARRVIELHDNPGPRLRMGEQAYERVRDKFSMDALTRNVDALYRELLGRRPAAR